MIFANKTRWFASNWRGMHTYNVRKVKKLTFFSGSADNSVKSQRHQSVVTESVRQMPSVFVFAVDIVAGMARTPPIVADWHCLDRRCLSQCGGMSSKCSLCGVRVTDAVHSRIIGFVSSLLYYTCTTINISRVSFRDRQKKTAERHTKTQRHVSTCSASRDVRRKKQWESCSPVTAQEWSQWAMKRQHQQC